MFRVIQPTFGTPSGEYERQCGVTISRHRTQEAAERAIAKELRALRKQAGMQKSYLDRRIVKE